MNVDDVLGYWFGKRGSDASWLPEDKMKLWFTKSEYTDSEIRERFGNWVEAALTGDLDEWKGDSHGCLALILLLDQFTRNIYRGSPDAFTGDAAALTLAKELIKGEIDQLLPLEKVFVFLPLEHSETLEDQDASVELFTKLLQEVPEEVQGPYRNFLDYAERHRAVIRRFGRFPHRNRTLGRESTSEELEFLEQPGSSF